MPQDRRVNHVLAANRLFAAKHCGARIFAERCRAFQSSPVKAYRSPVSIRRTDLALAGGQSSPKLSFQGEESPELLARRGNIDELLLKMSSAAVSSEFMLASASACDVIQAEIESLRKPLDSPAGEQLQTQSWAESGAVEWAVGASRGGLYLDYQEDEHGDSTDDLDVC